MFVLMLSGIQNLNKDIFKKKCFFFNFFFKKSDKRRYKYLNGPRFMKG